MLTFVVVVVVVVIVDFFLSIFPNNTSCHIFQHFFILLYFHDRWFCFVLFFVLFCFVVLFCLFVCFVFSSLTSAYFFPVLKIHNVLLLFYTKFQISVIPKWELVFIP